MDILHKGHPEMSKNIPMAKQQKWYLVCKHKPKLSVLRILPAMTSKYVISALSLLWKRSDQPWQWSNSQQNSVAICGVKFSPSSLYVCRQYPMVTSYSDIHTGFEYIQVMCAIYTRRYKIQKEEVDVVAVHDTWCEKRQLLVHSKAISAAIDASQIRKFVAYVDPFSFLSSFFLLLWFRKRSLSHKFLDRWSYSFYVRLFWRLL